jgi:hypothetical protein
MLLGHRTELADKAVRAPGKSSRNATMLGDNKAKEQRAEVEFFITFAMIPVQRVEHESKRS